MLSKTVVPKTKAELIAALQRASIKSVEVFEGGRLAYLPTYHSWERKSATVIVLS